MRRLWIAGFVTVYGCASEQSGAEGWAVRQCPHLPAVRVPVAVDYEPVCPPHSCSAQCGSVQSKVECCVRAYGGLPVTHEDAAICIAQGYGLIPSLDQYVAVLGHHRVEGRGELWTVLSVFEDECDFPGHYQGVLFHIDAETAELASWGWITATTARQCESKTCPP